MICRFGPTAVSRCRTSVTALVLAPTQSALREFHSVYGIAASLAMCTGCVLCFGSWANKICNVRKYGRWRFCNSLDDAIMVSDFKTAQYIGGFIEFLLHWFIVGPKKYRYDSNLADVPDKQALWTVLDEVKKVWG
ncbi:hypothetical protein TraAM80_00127 [Trypanosoma rangeli]|uniref:Uncharacterized protein n=1 Tax=Trypanosoma rangeli TaxID=5698 RepID=A0A422P4W3_TRYRA|nr:uncharacterized protein TraAM80_00127 [Trypanosoma rangeli]RNF12772.1 hypothetical protein TraAM80_00127 [Trypanosoma rangeli]|eukprot:RNF12772.1 hypothetical protein TraAM80_00127 [Trypanosoma rangeli]